MTANGQEWISVKTRNNRGEIKKFFFFRNGFVWWKGLHEMESLFVTIT